MQMYGIFLSDLQFGNLHCFGLAINITIPFSPFFPLSKKSLEISPEKAPKNRLWVSTFPFHQRKRKVGRKYAAAKTTERFRESCATWDQASVALMSVNACQMLQGLIFPRTPNDFQWANYYVSVSWFLGLFLGVGDQEQKALKYFSWITHDDFTNGCWIIQ